MNALNPAEFERLSVDEQILLVQKLWDQIASRPEHVAVTEAQRRELERRLEAHHQSPEDAQPWELVRERIRAPK